MLDFCSSSSSGSDVPALDGRDGNQIPGRVVEVTLDRSRQEVLPEEQAGVSVLDEMHGATSPDTAAPGSPFALGATLRMLKTFLILALAMVALVVLVPPGGEFPIDIDWNYARVVQTLVDQGQLEISPWTAASLVFQVYWGALFVEAFGFSHTVLRTSTLVLGAAGVVGFYVLLRRLVDPALALLGALLLLFNPLFIGLAYSFK